MSVCLCIYLSVSDSCGSGDFNFNPTRTLIRLIFWQFCTAHKVGIKEVGKLTECCKKSVNGSILLRAVFGYENRKTIKSQITNATLHISPLLDLFSGLPVFLPHTLLTDHPLLSGHLPCSQALDPLPLPGAQLIVFPLHWLSTSIPLWSLPGSP
jgi:hypothetical protein